ncbi:hypothetical protein E4O03_00395 [Treponema sp. OMZ 792]|uniref:hypothetical protein n=1 Tax=unclassified Treponema TaxID=2638727 RepID=UPI0020A5F42C|nr:MULTISPECIES: hypothetical protein [unclassified Treponema]UTC75226.1 hypothetical protein E4O03_00395 [Treponema sp. OMZ 792]UTC78977.1 hypothetical protein E4O04_13605 [Treponema sp. OMZ 799]UTC79233.1 hypothetical protein E4O07_00405 [Treponema sp. OMZ 798]
MKKNKKFLSFLVLSLFTVIMLLTCKPLVSLGTTVDVLPPEGRITYPETGETPIRGSFIIKGTAFDDEEVKSVSVMFKNKENPGIQKGPFPGHVTASGSGNVTWEIAINNESTGTEDGHPLVKIYPIPDGEYEITVTIKDKNDKITMLNKTYKIDNTPPVFIVSRPSLVAIDEDPYPTVDQYGAVMKIEGSAGDMHELSLITLKVRDDLSITKQNKENSVDIVMAAYPDQYYSDLINNGVNIDKPIRADIKLQDNARMYNGSVDNKGNESDFYYVKNEIEGSVDLNKYTAKVISDYFSGKKGKDGGTSHEQAIYDLRKSESESIRNILLNKQVKPSKNKSVFSLNPDKSPGFKVIGAHPVIFPEGSTNPAPLPAPMLFGSSSSLTVELYPNMDKNALVAGTDYAGSELKVILCKGNTVTDLKNGNYTSQSPFFDATVPSPDFSGVTQSGGLIKITKPLPGDIEPGLYRINVEGHDVKGNSDFTPYNDKNKPSNGLLIVDFKAAGAPYMFPHQPNEYQNGDVDISCAVENLAGGSVYYKIDSPADAETPTDTDFLLTQVGATNIYKGKVKVAGLSEGRRHIHFRARSTNSVFAVGQVSFVLDRTNPKEPSLLDPLQTVFSTWSRTFKGTAADMPIGSDLMGSGIDKVTYKIGAKIGGNINYEADETPARLIPPETGLTEYKWEAIVSFRQKQENYVLVSVYDKAGNKTDKEFGPYEVNTDAPQIKFDDVRFSLGATYVEASPITLVKQNTVIGNYANKQASFRIFAKNAFGIKTVKVSIGGGVEKNGTKTGVSGDYEEWTINDVDLAHVEGNPNFKLYVESNSGTVTEWPNPIVVDFTAPKVTQSSPDLQNIFFKEVKLMGNIVDESASGNVITSGVNEMTVKYKIGNSGFLTSHVHNSEELSKIIYSGGAWTIVIPDIAKYQTFSGVSAPGLGSSIYSIPIVLQASDKAGNEVTSSQFSVKFDPAGGTPFAELVSPKNGDALGGDILISGSAHVANPASGKTVKKIYLQLGKTRAELEANTAWSLNNQNYGSATGVQIYPDSGNADVYYWNHILPSEVKTDILAGADKKEVFLRVKAENSDGLIGDWTSIVSFTINTDVAQFTGIKQLVPNNAPPPDYIEETYVQNSVWVKGDLFKIKGAVRHSAGIKPNIKAESPPTLPAGYQSLDTSNTLGWFTEGNINDNGDIVTVGGLPGYAFTIPIKTSHYTKKAGNIQFDISAIDARNDGSSVPVSYTIVLRYDNSLPSAVFGTAAGKFKKAVFTATSASGVSVSLQGSENITQAVARLKKNIGNLVLFAETKDGSAKAVKITNIEVDGSHAKVTFASTGIFADSANCILIEQNPIVFDKDGSNYQLQGFAYDSGSKTKTLSVKFGDTSMADINKFDAEIGDFVSFKHSIETKNINDGMYSLKLNATDDAGNKGDEYSCPIYVRNKPLKLTNVSFSTDLNGSNSYSNNVSSGLIETVTKNGDDSYIDEVKNYSQTIDIASEFTIKNADKSQIKFELLGGYGARSYKLYKADSSGNQSGAPVKTGTLSSSNSNPELNDAINFENVDFGNAAIQDGDNQKFVIVLTDSASVEDTGRKLTLKVTFNVKTKDTRKPSAFVSPFYWNGENENSLVSNSRDKGHIEIAKVSSGAGESDVSGQVVIRGTAYHPTKLTKLTLTVDGSEKKAEYAAGSWTSLTDLKVKDTRLDVNGHWVSWEYSWITGTPGNNKQILLKAYHSGTVVSGNTVVGSLTKKNAQARTVQSLTLAPGDKAVPGQFIRIVGKTGSTDADASYLLPITSVNGSVVEWKDVLLPTVANPATDDTLMSYYLYPVGYAGDEPSFNKPAMSVNVVPYVTGIKTALSKLGGNDPDLYARTATGRYPVEDKEKIEIQGFNLTGAAVTVGGVSSGTLTDTGSPWSLTLDAGAKSGALELTVTPSGGSAVKAVNNINNNEKPYNKAKKTASNDKLTDDLFLDVWQFNSKAALPGRGVITEPVMRINPSNGMIGFAFANGPDFFSMSNGTSNSYTKWQRNYDDYGNVEFVYDSVGKSHGVAVGRDINSGGNQGGKFAYFTSQWGTGSVSDQGANYNGQQSLRLESIGQVDDMNGSGGAILDKTRIQHPSLAAAKRTANETRVYLAYYDGINDQIRFKYGTIADSLTYTSPPANNENPSPTRFGQFVDEASKRAVQPYSQANVSIVAGEYKSSSAVVNTGNATGTYLSLGVVSGTTAAADTAVLIWFDETNRKLKYTYKTDPQNGNHASQSGNGSGTWKKPIDVFNKMNVGEYCKIAVDKAGGIHIAAFDSDTADLKYAYLASYNAASFQTSTVDSYGIAGTHITLDVAYTAAGKPVPYIGYYSASAGRSKLAYLVDTETGVSGSAQGTDDTGYFTGKWEVSVVPTASRVQQDNINVGVWKTSGGVIKNSVTGTNSSGIENGTVYGNGTANPVLAYAIRQAMNGYIETAQKK